MPRKSINYDSWLRSFWHRAWTIISKIPLISKKKNRLRLEININFVLFQEISAEELREKLELVKKLKNELKNEEMALVLLKKIKQSQTARPEVTTGSLSAAASLGGGATITPTTKLQNSKNDPKTLSRQNSANDMLNSEKLVSFFVYILFFVAK